MLKSADEAKKHLTSSSQEIAERLRKLSSNLGANGNKLGEVLGIMGKGFDDVPVSYTHLTLPTIYSV